MPKLNKVQNAISFDREGETVGRMDIAGEVGWDYYGDAWDAGYFQAQLTGLGPVSLLEVHINSPGGDVFAGVAMFQALVQHPAPVHVYIDGMAASIASVIAMAGDKIFMPSNTMMFIHDPWMFTSGNAKELRKDADNLDKIAKAVSQSYSRHLKGSSDILEGLMAEETLLTASETAELFNNVSVLEQKAAITELLDVSNLWQGEKVPVQACAFAYKASEEVVEEPAAKESKLPGFIVNFLNKKGFNKAASQVQEHFKKEEFNALNEQETDDMKKEEVEGLITEGVAGAVPAIAAEASKAVMASLVELGVVKAKASPEDAPEAIAFEGDATKKEDIQAHQAKLNAVKAKAIMESGDPEAIQKYLDSLETPTASASALIGSNVDEAGVRKDLTTEQKHQNASDTEAFMLSALPKT